MSMLWVANQLHSITLHVPLALSHKICSYQNRSTYACLGYLLNSGLAASLYFTLYVGGRRSTGLVGRLIEFKLYPLLGLGVD